MFFRTSTIRDTRMYVLSFCLFSIFSQRPTMNQPRTYYVFVCSVFLFVQYVLTNTYHKCSKGIFFIQSICLFFMFFRTPTIRNPRTSVLSGCFSLCSLKDLLWTTQGHLFSLSVLYFLSKTYHKRPKKVRHVCTCMFLPLCTVLQNTYHKWHKDICFICLFVLYVLSKTYYEPPKDVCLIILFSMLSPKYLP